MAGIQAKFKMLRRKKERWERRKRKGGREEGRKEGERKEGKKETSYNIVTK